MAKGKFHVNDEGRVMPCNAQSGNCPFGGDDQHFDNFEEAQLAADKKNELLTKGNDDLSSSKTQKEKKMENSMTTEAIENLRNNLRALDNESLIDIFTNTRRFLDADFLDDVLLTQVRVIREEMLQRMSGGADKKKITREKIEKALETLKRTYEEILLNEEDEVERENLLSFYRNQIEETTAKLKNSEEEKKKNLKILQNELNTTRKALQHLADYQSVFEYNEQSEEDWNNLQETMRELYVIQGRLQK